MPDPAPAGVVSLGCRLNIAESETMARLLAGRDVAVVNTCAVTGEAVKRSRQAIRRLRAARPTAQLVATGCAATIDAAAFAAMPEVDRVLPNAAKLLPASWAANGGQRLPVSRSTARAFVGVQDGCDHACTFCTIPAGRGPSRSTPASAIVDAVRGLVDEGAREVVLTGVDLTSYLDDDRGLGQLVERLVRDVPDLPRLRLSSIDAVEIDDLLFELVTGEQRIMPHLHLSLQAGDDLVLKRMKRRHARADAVRLIERLKAARPDMAIGADLIAGFPTETEAQAANTLALLDDADIVHAHVFPYSPRPGTPAARMPQVAPEVRRARAERLRAAAATRHARWLAGQIGTVQPVLIERPGDRGHTPGFADVRLAGQRPVGSIATLQVIGATATYLVGH